MRPFVDRGDDAAEARIHYYRFCIEVPIMGLTGWLAAQHPDIRTT
jgi:hypothetical protein